MEVSTSIAESIHATDQYAQYDVAYKRVLSEKIVQTWIMKSCLNEFIRSLMANTGWTLERAMEALGIPEPGRPKYAGLLQKQ